MSYRTSNYKRITCSKHLKRHSGACCEGLGPQNPLTPDCQHLFPVRESWHVPEEKQIGVGLVIFPCALSTGEMPFELNFGYTGVETFMWPWGCLWVIKEAGIIETTPYWSPEIWMHVSNPFLPSIHPSFLLSFFLPSFPPSFLSFFLCFLPFKRKGVALCLAQFLCACLCSHRRFVTLSFETPLSSGRLWRKSEKYVEISPP